MLENKKKHLFYYSILFFVLIILIEILLNLLASFSISIAQIVKPGITPVIEDSLLGHRPNPKYPGHDLNGFRNVDIPKVIDILAFGDSQTYGTGVEAMEAWPRRLEELTKKKVYSMAYGGYCAVHSLALWEEGMALQPKIVIEAFYMGNDLFDAFDLIYNHHTLELLKTKDLLLQQDIQRMENEKPIKEKVVNLFRKGKRMPVNGFSLKVFLSKYSRIYALLRSVKVFFLKKDNIKFALDNWNKEKKITQQFPGHFQILENDQFKTIFTNSYRLIALDTSDIRIKEGLNITLSAIEKMNALAEKKDIDFVVLGIPTKELVFRPFLDSLHVDFEKTTNLEAAIWKENIKFYKKKQIHFIDGLQPLRRQLAIGKQPYHQSRDGHINQLGHESIAESIQYFLDSIQLLKE